MYFLHEWKAGAYRAALFDYINEEFDGQSGKPTFEKVFGRFGLDVLEKEFLAMVDDLRAALRDNRIVNGKLLPK